MSLSFIPDKMGIVVFIHMIMVGIKAERRDGNMKLLYKFSVVYTYMYYYNFKINGNLCKRSLEAH